MCTCRTHQQTSVADMQLFATAAAAKLSALYVNTGERVADFTLAAGSAGPVVPSTVTLEQWTGRVLSTTALSSMQQSTLVKKHEAVTSTGTTTSSSIRLTATAPVLEAALPHPALAATTASSASLLPTIIGSNVLQPETSQQEQQQKQAPPRQSVQLVTTLLKMPVEWVTGSSTDPAALANGTFSDEVIPHTNFHMKCTCA
jgi:hypothetical protein